MASKANNVSKNEAKSGSKIKQWIMGLVANTTIFSYSMQTGWMSPTIHVLQATDSPSGYPLSDFEISLIASAISIAAVFSSVAFSIVMDECGRRVGLILVAIFQALAWIIKIISANTVVLIISQIFSGISGGGVFSVAPIYTKEISEDSIRGAMGGVGMLLQSVGLLVMYSMGAFLNYHLILWIVVWIPIMNIVALFWAPESPPYLVKKGKLEEAEKTICYLTGLESGDKKVAAAVSELGDAQAQCDNLPKVTVKKIFQEKFTRRAFVLGFFMITLLDIGGNFAIFTYASVIVKNSGVTMQPEIQAMSFPAVMLFGAALSTVMVEKFGRKPLLISCLIINGLPMIILGTVLLLQHYGTEVASWIPVMCVVTSVFAYGAGVLPIPYIVMAEIFSFQLRAKVMGVYVTYGWFLCFMQVIFFGPVSNALGMYTMFFIFGSFNLLSAALAVAYMPETKGKSLDQIEKELRAKVMGVYVTYGWFLCFMQVIFFGPVSNALGMYTMFFIFGSFNLLSAALAVAYMPETKGKSLDQIEKELSY